MAEDKQIETIISDVVDNTKDTEIANLKKLLSNANSEAAKYKRELRDREASSEQYKSEATSKTAELEQQIAALQKVNTINTFKAQYMGLGFDEEMATSTATAMADGDTATVFANLKTLTKNISEAAVVKAMDNQSGLTKGEPLDKDVIEKSKLDAMRKAAGL